MTLTPITNGQPVSELQNSLPLLGITQAGMNLIRQLQDRAVTFSAGQMEGWAEAYVDADGRGNSVDTSTTNAIFDTNKYTPLTTEPFVVIEATSISSISDFAINNCVINNLDTGKWILTCTTGTDEVRRAQIYKTLFYGSAGTDPRASSTYITGITALKTSVTRDVGKQAHLVTMQTDFAGDGAGAKTYTGTFADTSTNTDCSTWSRVRYNWYCNHVRWEMPSATTLNGTSGGGTSDIDEFGTDTTADEQDNPATCQGDFQVSSDTQNQIAYIDSLVLCKGDISWVQSGTFTVSNVDFLTDNSIPVFTATSGSDNVVLIHHTLPTGTFSPTISSAIGFGKYSSFGASSDVEFKLYNGAISETSFVIIEAEDYVGTGTLNYSCEIRKIAAGKWIIFNSAASSAEKLPKIYAALFNDYLSGATTGGEAEINNFIDVTAVKTTEATHVGRSFFSSILLQQSGYSTNVSSTYTGTFSDTSTNTGVNFWSDCVSSVNKTARFEAPSATTINSGNLEIGTDTSGDNLDNPATCQSELSNIANGGGTARIIALVLSKGDVSWVYGAGDAHTAETDWSNDNSIPLLTAVTETGTYSADDSGWLPSGNAPLSSSFTTFTTEPTNVRVKINGGTSFGLYGFYVRAE